MTTPIVMLVGPGRSGKDTAGEAIARELGGVCVALADPIKRTVKRAFDFSADQLWGKTKDVEVDITKPWYELLHRSFYEALAGWRTPAELSKFSIERWLLNLPKRTTPRHVMQTFGTECVRAVVSDFWVHHGLWTANRLLNGGALYDREMGLISNADCADAFANVVCFTDGRFRNEALGVKRKGGVLLEVWRPEVQQGFSASAKAHASETEQSTIPRWWFDGRLENDGTLGQFQGQAVSMAKHLLGA